MSSNRASHITRQIFLGSDGASRNEAYLVWYPLLLAAAGLIGIVSPTPGVLVGCLVLASLVACASLLALCSARAKLRVSRVLGTGLLQGYAVGALPTAFSSMTSRTPGSVLYSTTVETYALALCQVFLGVGLLWLVGEFTEPFLPIPALTPPRLRALRRFAWICGAAVAFGLVTGRISYMGAESDVAGGEGHTTVLVSLVSWIVGVGIGVTTPVFAAAKEREKKLLYGGLLLLQLFGVIPTGRRNFLYAVLLFFILYSTWKPSFSRSGWKLTAAVLSTVAVISIAWTTFLFLRLATYTFGDDEAPRLSSLANRAWTIYNSADGETVLDKWSHTDVEDRTDIIGFDTDLLQRTAVYAPAYGGGAWEAMLWAVPHALWPAKQLIAEEEYASELFHADYPDEANSIFTAATIDFGFWGGLFYPILVSWFLSLVLRLCRWLFPAVMAYSCACVLLLLCLATEVGLGTYVIAVRDTLLFTTLFSVVLWALPSLFQAGKPQRPRSVRAGWANIR